MKIAVRSMFLTLVACLAAAQAQVPVVRGVVNSASFTPGAAVAPGSIISLFGDNFAAGQASAAAIPLPTSLGGVSVTVNGSPAPLFFVSSGQINAQLPFETAGGTASTTVTTAAGTSAPFSFSVAATGPGLFLWSGDRAVAQNQDGSLNTATRAAQPNEVITAYLTGQGQLDNAVATGAAASASPLSRPVAAKSAALGATPAVVEFLGLTPGLVGLLQANIRIPNLPSGEYQLSVAIGGVTSNTGVVSVQSATSSLVADLGGGVTMQFVSIPAGEFMMGCSTGDAGCAADESPVHQVRITKAFEMGKYEVTQAQWQTIMGNNPSFFKSANRPVDLVMWDAIQPFLTRLNERNDGYRYRLPTEAEWEYAARAGSTDKNAGGVLDQIAWHAFNSGAQTHPVGEKMPNAWGLYDMLGNVFEWSQDWYGSYPSGTVTDPSGPSSGSYRAIRGGSVVNYPAGMRVSYREAGTSDFWLNFPGFRCVRDRITP